MRSRGTLVPEQFLGSMFDRPRVVRAVLIAIPLAVGVGVVIQRWGHAPLASTVALVALAIGPLITGALGFDVGWVVGMAASDVAVYLLLEWSGRPFDLAPFFLLVTLAAVGLVRPPANGLLCLASGIGALSLLEYPGHFTGTITWAIGMTATWAAAFGVQQLFDLVGQLTDAQRDLAERSATDERRRIAAELHDVIAHSLAVTMLHVTGARLALETDDRTEAIEALAEAERSGRASLADVRRTVGLLADGAGGATALPDAAAVPGLIEGFRSAGLSVRFHVDGDLADVAPAVGLALYRVTQESLANVARHSPHGDVEVRIGVTADALRLSVRNPAAPDALTCIGQGHGVTGMHDRVTSLGGTFSAGPSDGAWVVAAELPR